MQADPIKLNAHDSVATATKKLLSSMLEQTIECLRSTSKPESDAVKKIHQLRISVRRSLAGLKLFRQSLPRKLAKRLANRLRQILRVSGAVRELDVLISQLAAEPPDGLLLKKLRRKRERARKTIFTLQKRLGRKHRFQKHCRKLLSAIERNTNPNEDYFSSWVKPILWNQAVEFFDRQPTKGCCLRELHRFRIAGKKLRYSIELLTPAFPVGTLEAVSMELTELQKLLGEINDRVDSISRLRRMTAKGLAVTAQLLSDEIESLELLEQRFSDWWTPATADNLRQRIEACLKA